MKKILAITLALVMVLALAACGSETGNPGNTDNPGTSQTGNNGGTGNGDGESADNQGGTGNENKEPSFDGQLSDIAEDKITVSDKGTVLDGDAAAEAKKDVPAELKKVAGEIDLASSSITLMTATGEYRYTLTMNLIVPNIEQCEELVRYYKSLDGTITGEDKVGSQHLFAMSFSWGEIQCQYSDTLMKVQAVIK